MHTILALALSLDFHSAILRMTSVRRSPCRPRMYLASTRKPGTAKACHLGNSFLAAGSFDQHAIGRNQHAGAIDPVHAVNIHRPRCLADDCQEASDMTVQERPIDHVER